MRFPVGRLVALITVATVSGGCFKPFLKRDEVLKPDQPVRTWVHSLVVDGSQVSPLFLIGLKDAKDQLAPLLHEALLRQGLDTYLDATRARKCGVTDVTGSTGMAVLKSYWFHPDGFQQPINSLTMFSTGGAVYKKCLDDDFKDPIISIRMEYGTASLPIIGVLVKPSVRIHIIGITPTGKKYFDSEVIGTGSYSPIFPNLSTANQLAAVKDALSQLASVKPELLKNVLTIPDAAPPAAVVAEAPPAPAATETPVAVEPPAPVAEPPPAEVAPVKEPEPAPTKEATPSKKKGRKKKAAAHD